MGKLEPEEFDRLRDPCDTVLFVKVEDVKAFLAVFGCLNRGLGVDIDEAELGR